MVNRPDRPPQAGMRDVDFAAADENYKNDPNVQLVREASELRALWNSPVGRIIERKIEELRDDGVVKMLDLDIEDDVKAWRKAKLDILVAERVVRLFEEAFQEGEIAQEILEDEDRSLRGN